MVCAEYLKIATAITVQSSGKPGFAVWNHAGEAAVILVSYAVARIDGCEPTSDALREDKLFWIEMCESGPMLLRQWSNGS
jgi:hypothetical protein